MNKTVAALACVVLLAGCSSSAPTMAPLVEVPTEVPTVEPTLTLEPTPEPAPTAEPTDAPPVETPEPAPTTVPLGSSARVVRDDGSEWSIAIGKPNFNAWKVLQAENQFNEKPPEGSVAVLIPVRATLRTNTRTTFNPATYFLVYGEGTSTERTMFEGDTCGVIPDDLMLDDPMLREGGKVSGNICFVVPSEDVDSLVLLWTPDAYGLGATEPFTAFDLR